MKKRRERLKRIWIAAACTVLVMSTAFPVAARAEEQTEPAAAVMTSEDPSEGTEEGGGQDEETLARIQLSVGDDQKTPTFKAGEKTTLQINVMNNGNTTAQNVRIAPVVTNASDWVFEMDQLNYEQSLGDLEAGKQITATWGGDEKLKVRDDVSGKNYKLEFCITYDDGKKEYSINKYVFVKTTAKKKPAQDTSSGTQGGSSNTQGSGSGSQGGSGSASQGSSGSGSDGLGGGSVYNSDPVVSGGSGEEGIGSVPRVIVTGFDTQPGEVRAGSDFKLIVHLKNTSKKTAVSNMVFDLQAAAAGTEAAAEAPAFLPSSGSSSIYLEKIPAGGTKDISIDLNARADLIHKPYSIDISMKYEDSSAGQYEAQSSVAIPVIQEARFEFSEIQIAPDTISVGEEANISCSLYNLGRVKMYNVKARIEGAMIEAEEQFVGNLEAGATGMIDSIVTAVQETMGEEECKLVLTYEDDSGNVSTYEQSFMMNVMAQMMPEDVDMTFEEIPEESHIPIGLIAVIAVVVIAGIGTAVFLIKNKKKKTREAEEEELLDEVERFTEDEH